MSNYQNDLKVNTSRQSPDFDALSDFNKLSLDKIDEVYESLNAAPSDIGKKIPKIKVCHKSNEFNILSAMMDKLNSQNIKQCVSNENN